MGKITTTQNLVAIKEVRHTGQWTTFEILFVFGVLLPFWAEDYFVGITQ